MRPPGHHAKHDHYAGFSFFNNVALAAQKAASQGKRVLIFDWDVHHGDGTQTMFYDSDQVLFMSLHRFDDGTFYPRNGIGAPSYTGEGKGAFHNVNCAWNTGLVHRLTGAQVRMKWPCKLCRKVFKNQYYLRKHKDVDHDGKKGTKRGRTGEIVQEEGDKS